MKAHSLELREMITFIFPSGPVITQGLRSAALDLHRSNIETGPQPRG